MFRVRAGGGRFENLRRLQRTFLKRLSRLSSFQNVWDLSHFPENFFLLEAMRIEQVSYLVWLHPRNLTSFRLASRKLELIPLVDNALLNKQL